jgi:hypothetical protein
MPLEVGNSWTYAVSSARRTLGTERLQVVEELKPLFENDTYRRFRVREPETTAVWSEDRKTVMRTAGKTLVTVLQHPPFVNSGWTDTAPDGSAVYCRVVRREMVSTAAGEFLDCVVVRREAADLSSVVTQWFAPDIGLAKWRVERPGALTVEWSLKEYATKR